MAEESLYDWFFHRDSESKDSSICLLESCWANDKNSTTSSKVSPESRTNPGSFIKLDGPNNINLLFHMSPEARDPAIAPIPRPNSRSLEGLEIYVPHNYDPGMGPMPIWVKGIGWVHEAKQWRQSESGRKDFLDIIRHSEPGMTPFHESRTIVIDGKLYEYYAPISDK